MIGFDFNFIDTSKLIATAAKNMFFKNLSHLVATIRKEAQASIDVTAADEPSRPGEPPNSRDGRLGRAITFDVDKEAEVAVVGPRESVIGQAGAQLEHGETLGETTMAARPYMHPVYERNLPRFPESFRGALKE